MPQILKQTTIVANTTNENVIAGSLFEFARSNQLLSMGSLASGDGLLLTISVGDQVILEESPMPEGTDFPRIPDEMYFNDVAAQGDRIVVKIRNSTAGDLIARTIVQAVNV